MTFPTSPTQSNICDSNRISMSIPSRPRSRADLGSARKLRLVKLVSLFIYKKKFKLKF
jgi:hypothetical protein